MVETSSTSSFIPKNANRVRKPRTSKRIYIFSYISYVFFFGTLLTVVGVYVYSSQVEQTLEEQKQLLAAERQRFSESDIEYVRDLEKRLMIAERLLDQSTAPSRIFTALEEVIVDTMRIADFAYERDSDNTFVLTFAGATDTFDSAMFQRDLMRSVPAFADAVITEYSYGSGGEGEGENVETIGEERLVVTFENAASTSLFPYVPPEEEEEETAAATTTTSTGSDVTTGN